MIDIATQINAIDREVTRRHGPHGEEVSVLIRRTYDAGVADVWEALTDPDRMKRWFFPISGDLRVGGSFQLEGNAAGDILRCEPPRLLEVSFGGPTSLVELRLSPEGEERTRLELEHTVPIEIAQSSAGSLYVGPGWDGGFVALDLYLRGEISDDRVAAANSPEGQQLSRQSVDAWRAVVQASGTATAEEIAAATQMALAQFAPDMVDIGDDEAAS
ncbi:MAG TPA: SRPBCC family protein [Acidimicrobiia bacterium]|nr:SRPBCC family protein [Acidimicrobiia bacterium]